MANDTILIKALLRDQVTNKIVGFVDTDDNEHDINIDSSQVDLHGVGNYLEAVRASTNTIALTSGSDVNTVSIELSAGKWELFGTGSFGGNTASRVYSIAASISPSTAFNSTNGNYSKIVYDGAWVNFNGHTQLPIGPVRVEITEPTTFYLILKAFFDTSTEFGYGRLHAFKVKD
jgi:hypothetical protein